MSNDWLGVALGAVVGYVILWSFGGGAWWTGVTGTTWLTISAWTTWLTSWAHFTGWTAGADFLRMDILSQ